MLSTLKLIEPFANFPLTIFGQPPAPPLLAQREFANNLRQNFPPLGNNEYARQRTKIFEQLRHGHLFSNYPVFTPLFFKQNHSIIDFFQAAPLVHLIDMNIKEGERVYECYKEKFDSLEESKSSFPSPDKIYYQNILLENIPILTVSASDFNYVTPQTNSRTEVNFKPVKTWADELATSNPNITISTLIQEHLNSEGSLIFTYEKDSSLEEFKYFLDISDIQKNNLEHIHFFKSSLAEGIYCPDEFLLILTEKDVFSKRRKSAPPARKNNRDLFAERISSLKEGDYIIHSEYGIGQYMGLVSVDIGGQPTDYLSIVYAKGDKIYVPVYKMNLLQKHAESNAELKVDSLRANRFKRLKNRPRPRLKNWHLTWLSCRPKETPPRPSLFPRPMKPL